MFERARLSKPLPIEFAPWLEQWRSRTKEPSRLWGLALGADIALMNGSRLTCLHTGYNRRSEREGLEHWWSVTSADTLRYQLRALLQYGHSGSFEQIVDSLREGDLLKERHIEAPPRRIRFVRRHASTATAMGHIRGFDLGRVPALARFGFSAGYIGSAEAWEWILDAAEAVQPLFKSWREYAVNYRFGLEFWNSADPDDVDRFLHRQYLLNDPTSPWVTLPWRMPLK